jgi:LysR family transcriptional regulator of gallate degradation
MLFRYDVGMEIQQLRHFVTVVELGSYSAASRHLHITQPGLSRSINALEERLGLTLLERSSKGMVPSQPGTALLGYARTILNDHDRATREMAAFRGIQRGQVSIGMATIFNHIIGPDIVAVMARRGISIDLSVEAGEYDDLARRVIDGSIDFALSLFAPVHHPDLVHVPLVHLHSTVFAGPDHPLRAMPRLGPAQLASCPWLVSGNQRLRQAVTSYFEKNGVPPPPMTIAPSSLTLVVEAVASCDLLTILPVEFEHITQGRLTPIPIEGEGPLPLGTMAGLLMRQGHLPNIAARTIADIAREAGEFYREAKPPRA